MRRAKVAIVHPKLSFGGSEARALWVLEALKRDYDVSLITCGPVDLPRLNAYYGTSLQPGDFTLLHARLFLFSMWVSGDRFNALRAHILQRYCQRVAPQFDLMISARNPCNFGVPGIQCVADFSFVPEWRFTLHPALQGYRRWWYGDSPLRRAYLGLCNLISPSQPKSWKEDLVVANSDWSGTLMREKFGIETRLLYPPVADDFPSVPDDEREDGFVCIGSAVPEKRVDAIIDIVGKVRQRGHDVHLHVAGGIDDSNFGQKLKQLSAAHRDWVYLEGRVVGERKKELIARHRFGINGCWNEAFGIAVAEMVKAGCIVFVPNGGGQVEIVNHPALIYENDDEAVRKIEAVLADSTLAAILRTHLAEGTNRFSVDGFMRGIRKIVIEFLQEKKIAREANH